MAHIVNDELRLWKRIVIWKRLLDWDHGHDLLVTSLLDFGCQKILHLKDWER